MKNWLFQNACKHLYNARVVQEHILVQPSRRGVRVIDGIHFLSLQLSTNLLVLRRELFRQKIYIELNCPSTQNLTKNYPLEQSCNHVLFYHVGLILSGLPHRGLRQKTFLKICVHQIATNLVHQSSALFQFPHEIVFGILELRLL